jgi:hypothetical protein
VAYDLLTREQSFESLLMAQSSKNSQDEKEDKRQYNQQVLEFYAHLGKQFYHLFGFNKIGL